MTQRAVAQATMLALGFTGSLKYIFENCLLISSSSICLTKVLSRDIQAPTVYMQLKVGNNVRQPGIMLAWDEANYVVTWVIIVVWATACLSYVIIHLPYIADLVNTTLTR